MNRIARVLLRLLWPALAILLLWLVLRSVSLRAVMEVLANLTVAEVAGLAVVNVLVLLTFSARWWLLLRAHGHRLPYLALVGYRLAGFAVSYVTPGPHFGGEPLQVYLVSRRHAVPAADSLSAVALDKTLEMVANFLFLLAGLLVLAQRQSLTDRVNWLLVAWGGLLLLVPLALLGALGRGRRPLSGAVALLGARWDRARRGVAAHSAPENRFVRTLHASETLMGEMVRTRPHLLLAGLALSLISWTGIIGEFWYMTHVLGLGLTPGEGVVALLAARVAILLPLPAALGALEAGQVLAMRTLGQPAATGVSISLLIRARDIALALVGLALAAGWGWRRASPPALPTATLPEAPNSESAIA